MMGERGEAGAAGQAAAARGLWPLLLTHLLPPCLHSWTDLVVGAPYFFERQEELGGAVYVYMNEGGHWAGVAPLRLCGSPDSMFGISLAVLGDLNQDGFPGVTGNGKGWGARREGPGRWAGRGL